MMPIKTVSPAIGDKVSAVFHPGESLEYVQYHSSSDMKQLKPGDAKSLASFMKPIDPEIVKRLDNYLESCIKDCGKVTIIDDNGTITTSTGHQFRKTLFGFSSFKMVGEEKHFFMQLDK